MKARDAVDLAQNLLQVRAYEARRLDLLNAALSPTVPYSGGELGIPTQQSVCSVPVDTDAKPALKRMAARSETNFLPLVLDTFSQVMKVDNYLSSDGSAAGPWKWWQRNQMDARQTGLHRSALHYGVAYTTVLPALTPGQEESGAEVFWQPSSPRQMTAVYGERMVWDPKHGGPIDDDWPLHALEVNGNMIRLYDESDVHFIGVKSQPHSTLGWTDPTYLRAENFAYIESRHHGIGVCPIVRYRDRVLLDGEEQLGIIEPLLAIQSRINETTFGMLVAQYFAAFKQRYIIGWTAKNEDEAMRMKVNNVWTFNDTDVKVGELNETDLTRYIESKDSGLLDMSAIGQLPPHALGLTKVSNISDTTLAALESAKERKSDEITTSFGESHEQAFRLAAYIDGDTTAAADFASEVKWRDASARSYAATVDALGKLGQMLGVPDEFLWEFIPGWTRETVSRAVAARRESDPLTMLYDAPAEPSESAQPMSSDLVTGDLTDAG